MTKNATVLAADRVQSFPQSAGKTGSLAPEDVLEGSGLKEVHENLMEECAMELMFEEYCSALAALLQNESPDSTSEHKRAMNGIARKCGVVLLPFPELEEE